jgi:hypothetical protein
MTVPKARRKRPPPNQRVEAPQEDASSISDDALPNFVVRFPYLDIHSSALKHGIPAEDIRHAARSAMAIDELDDNLVLILGPDRRAMILELVVIERADASALAIHAMRMRSKYQHLLIGGSQ